MHPFIILSFLSCLSFSFGQDYSRYTNCTQPFECGGRITNISFPFWGSNRADYCGQPGYQLRCEDDRIELVTGDTQSSYQVLSVNDTAHRVRIVSVDTLTDSCPAPSVNVSFPRADQQSFFSYSLPNTDNNITLFYDCPAIPQLNSYAYPCSPNGTSTRNYIWTDSMATVLPPEVWGCNVLVRVPVLQTLNDSVVISNPASSQQALKAGFEVGYTMNLTICRDCEASGGSCGYNWTTSLPLCFCYDNNYQTSCPTLRPAPSSNVRWKIAIGVLAAIGSVVVMALLVVFWKMLHFTSSYKIFWDRQNKAQRLVEDFLKNYGSLVPKRYSYVDIKKITSSFKDKIGQGGFGEVYKGKLFDGRLVAVKLLNDAKGTDGQEFINEVASISRTSHVNVVNLLGFCFDGSKRALIYEFMANGSLEKYIYGCNASQVESQLGWETLYQITVGVARGLEYLHRGCNTRILHFDIKPHNILLDMDFTPKISDFGLAKLCPRNESIISMLDARGTAGFIAPEVFNRQFGRVSHKSDVYSYGMMVLEIVGKRKNIDINVNHTSEIYFPNWIHKRLSLDEDLGLNGIMSAEEGDKARKMTLVALWCIQTNPTDRPTMTRVVEMLEGTHELLLIPPNPYLCSPPRSPRSPVSSATT